jgi:hypothetical protein
MPGNINGAQIHVNPTVTTTYSVTGSAGGCSVTSIAALTVNPIFDSTESMAICSVNSFVWHGQNLSATGTYFAHYLTKLGCDSTYSLNLNVVNCEFKILSLKLFLEGLYAGSNQMHQASGISEPQFDLGIADHINVSLNEATPPYALAYNFDNMEIYADGTIPSIHLPGSISGLYYIVVKHRNSIETWSAQPIDFSGVGNINYDFSTGVEQAYGNNMKLSDGVYTNWGGDVTQDGIVDGSDLAAVDNACLSMLVGYHPEDVNGDGIVDGSDLALIDNNSLALIKRMSP